MPDESNLFPLTSCRPYTVTTKRAAASHCWAALVLASLFIWGAQCGPGIELPGDQPDGPPVNPPGGNVTFSIDPTLTSPIYPSTVESEGQQRPVGLSQGPDGVIEAFVVDEVMIRAETQEELTAFLEKYNGIVIQDGSASNLPAELMVTPIEQSQWYLVRVDLSRSPLDDLPASAEAAGVQGNLVFSSEDAGRLGAIIAREAPNGAWANLLIHALSSSEHPTALDGNGNPIAFLDFENRFWMTEDDDPFTSGDQGLSIGVTHAWDYLAYKNVPPVPPPGQSVFFSPVRVAVIDAGFALDTSTGVPLLNNVDYFNSFSAPLQWDEANDDSRAGGASDLPLDGGGGSSAWHGQGAFGICCAAERNQFGSAGVGGPVAQPVLIRTGKTLYSLADSIYKAGNMGAQVISISLAANHGILSIISDTFWDNRIGDSVIACTRVGAVVVAGAGNAGVDLDDDRSILPCELLDVLCVGSIKRDTTTRHNFGRNVDISAPEGVLSTVNPETVALDADDVGIDELDEFNGTSCATPFVAGVVALMKAADPTLDLDRVTEILQSTANPSADSRVPNGYVDAYRAVRSVLSNQPPTVQITQPASGQLIGWKNQPFFRTLYSDPEVDPTDVTAINRFHGEVVIRSSIDGELCRDSSLPYECTSTLSELTLGQHIITATATDPFEGTSTHQIVVTVVNRPPQPEITKPVGTESLFSHIPVEFVAFVPDPDETITDAQIAWSSDLDGSLGTGMVLLQTLTAGTHTITMTATDGKGLSASDQVVVTVATGAGSPTPVITSPANATLFGPGQQVTLQGLATDPEDGTLSGLSLEWSSDRDGVLGTGESVTFTPSFVPSQTPGCPGGAEHVITLKATDSDNHVVTVTIVVNVGCIL